MLFLKKVYIYTTAYCLTAEAAVLQDLLDQNGTSFRPRIEKSGVYVYFCAEIYEVEVTSIDSILLSTG
jgi:hypothetical protein